MDRFDRPRRDRLLGEEAADRAGVVLAPIGWMFAAGGLRATVRTAGGVPVVVEPLPDRDGQEVVRQCQKHQPATDHGTTLSRIHENTNSRPIIRVYAAALRAVKRIAPYAGLAFRETCGVSFSSFSPGTCAGCLGKSLNLFRNKVQNQFNSLEATLNLDLQVMNPD